jgi:hypothetical protein
LDVILQHDKRSFRRKRRQRNRGLSRRGKGCEELLDGGISAIGHFRGGVQRLRCKAQVSTSDEVLSTTDSTGVGFLLVSGGGRGGGNERRRGREWGYATDVLFFLTVIVCRKGGRRRMERGRWERRGKWRRRRGGWRGGVR